MTAPIKFVILSQPRTGSTLLCSLLCSCPGVRALVEPINPRTHGHHMKPRADSTSLVPEQIVQTDIYYAMDRLFQAEPPPQEWIKNRKTGEKAAGFKIMAHQILGLKTEPDFWEYLASNKVKIILCFRQNILMQYVSDMITIVTRQPTCWDGNVKTGKATINTDTLRFELQKIVEQRQYLIDAVKRLKLDFRRVDYEDFKNSTLPIGDILYWLIGEQRVLTTKLSKQNPDSLKARVHNYDDVIKTVKDIGLAHLLADTELR